MSFISLRDRLKHINTTPPLVEQHLYKKAEVPLTVVAPKNETQPLRHEDHHQAGHQRGHRPQHLHQDGGGDGGDGDDDGSHQDADLVATKLLLAAVRAVVRSEVRHVVREELRALVGGELDAGVAEVDGLLDVKDAAELLGLSVSTVYKRAEAGTLPFVKDGSRLLFDRKDLVEYIEARRCSRSRVVAVVQAAKDDRRERSATQERKKTTARSSGAATGRLSRKQERR